MMLCLSFLAASSFSKDVVKTTEKEGTPIIVIAKGEYGDPDRNSIQASIDGHSLTVIFSENLGNVLIEVTTASGGPVDFFDIFTPNGYIAYIYDTGSYVINFTLENGNEYYGEFEVTD